MYVYPVTTKIVPSNFEFKTSSITTSFDIGPRDHLVVILSLKKLYVYLILRLGIINETRGVDDIYYMTSLFVSKGARLIVANSIVET